ncbi:SelB [Laribacter hongkongensis HLHK9]|uniref:Selenocysteine-specific elongation factor n=1 Tax=Laribacter hongkongensis (strain HLHK9) TaxID=557598 RepID=C1D4F7_LARHH|nr:selenocysteine-specific translation elongation factor [Laribacter hongkongensis]ACO73751.1 SelB [Laribacter hongkongensis HLHK9]
MLIATAGHVDHGKTSLLRALTGVDTDRLPEEKRRGMTIDLGYAYLPREQGEPLGFIDVPGHEKFLPNMLAGVGGIHHALLVVAADDGVMPQTREHLAILTLAGVRSLSVAISKCDLVSDGRIADVTAELHALLAAFRLTIHGIHPVSAPCGTGIDTLRDTLLALAATTGATASPARRFRLAIDRAFTVTGSGLVVTGTALAGQVAVGDSLWLTGADRPVRVRGLRAQHTPVEQAGAGCRLALNLAGDIGRDDIRRGDWLLAQEPPAPADRITVWLTASPLAEHALRHWQPVHLHHAASHVTGRAALLDHSSLAAGQTGLAELVLDQPLHLAAGDRLILRDMHGAETLGVAQVLELGVPARGKRTPGRLAYLAALHDALPDDDTSLAVLATRSAVRAGDFAWARQLVPAAAEACCVASPLRWVGRADARLGFSPLRWQALTDTLLTRLAQLHAEQPDQLGAGLGRLRRLALPQESEATVEALVDEAVAAGRLSNSRGFVHLPEHVLSFSPAETALWQQVEPCFGSGSEPCWVRDLAHACQVPEADMRQLLRKAARLGLVVAIVPDRYYPQATLAGLARIARELASDSGDVDAARFRDAIGVGRKLAIQILEFFDRSGFLRRQGNRHLLRDRQLF